MVNKLDLGSLIYQQARLFAGSQCNVIVLKIWNLVNLTCELDSYFKTEVNNRN